MASSNDLTDSTVLYGANYDEWKKRMMATLRLHGLAGSVLVNARAPISSATDDNAKKLAATFICLNVSPAILERVPVSEFTNPKLLLSRLETMTSYFRFFDLPPELRNRIYGFALSGCDRYVLKLSPGSTAPRTGYPAITKASRQIRAEILPLFYSATHFKLFFKDRPEPFTPEMTAAKLWLTKVVRKDVKHLKSVSMSMPVRVKRNNNNHNHNIHGNWNPNSNINES